MIGEIVSGALGALGGGFVTWLIAQRNLRSANVTLERTKWRDRIRDIAGSIAEGQPEDKKLWVALALSLNPNDQGDVATVLQAKGLSQKFSEDQLANLVARLAILLKHDWERAKIETSWWPFYASERAKKKVGSMPPNFDVASLTP